VPVSLQWAVNSYCMRLYVLASRRLNGRINRLGGFIVGGASANVALLKNSTTERRASIAVPSDLQRESMAIDARRMNAAVRRVRTFPVDSQKQSFTMREKALRSMAKRVRPFLNYSCPNCGVQLGANVQVSPLGDVNCQFCTSGSTSMQRRPGLIFRFLVSTDGKPH